MNNQISIEQNRSSQIGVLKLDIESLRINLLLIDILILVIIGLAVQVA
ncbi:MAG: hypothetical protein HN927_01475 [Candidatus Marinimicrobia bacterium]|nr:hypothetical protein [Candidatus Neomarinimicrobiota bacterium]MBT3948308.1 hypothetical protein [Candidatus Neomarinimicrobiota bacterium]MBT4307888.1 hypothetical protein [Candidatus Neomarinimicrobiota bacterium]MBT4452821.1 hypothetical protein [Candidatus Neomarinimicrobiota bacterium]MBT4737492.1 hypothetical protein [Candidatus Neomarinimicrobiota bacterium]